MSDSVKVALILSVAIVLATTIAVSALIYFSPYQSCMRVFLEDVEASGLAERLGRTYSAARECVGGPPG